MHNEQLWLITYDIAEPRRLRQVAKLMEEHGVRLQRSVFECLLTPTDLQRLQRRLEKEIEEEEDGIKFFPLCKRCAQRLTELGPGADPNRQATGVLID